LRNILKPSIAFNSGLEFKRKLLFVQGTVDFNSVKYDQMVKDEHSPYLFQNTSSSLLMLGVNGGRHFIIDENWTLTGYVGIGYINVGEPRVTIEDLVVKQKITRQGDVFGRVGSRVARKSPIKFLQTIYVEGYWWTSPVQIQNARLKGLGIYFGTRMAM